MDTYLVLAGSGKSRGMLEARDPRPRYPPADALRRAFCPGRKLDPLFQASDVFLFPSKTETQGLAVGEALAAGLPCVVVNAGGAPESVRDGVDGLLVADDARAMADRTLALLADPAGRRRLSEAARRGASARTPEAVGGRMVAVYEELIEARRGGGESGPRLDDRREYGE